MVEREEKCEERSKIGEMKMEIKRREKKDCGELHCITDEYMSLYIKTCVMYMCISRCARWQVDRVPVLQNGHYLR